MKAWILPSIVSLDDTDTPLECVDLPVPDPGPGEIRIQVAACGVCHTELDEIEGRTAPPRLPVIPGHEVIGRVAACGAGVTQWTEGDRVGVGWIHHSDGTDHENLATDFCATGRDVNGGYAEYMIASENYVFRIPEVFSDEQAAPLMCAGAVGYRALKLTGLRNGEPLGLTGFGGSAHLVLQLGRHLYPDSDIYVFARDPAAREFAVSLGAVWAGDTTDRPPQPLAAVIDTTPAWKPVVEAMASLKPAGRLVINAIRKEAGDQQELLDLSYHDHLWMEREIKTVANVTGTDIREFLPLAADIPLRPHVEVRSFNDANRAIIDLKRAPVRGAKVLVWNDADH